MTNYSYVCERCGQVTSCGVQQQAPPESITHALRGDWTTDHEGAGVAFTMCGGKAHITTEADMMAK